MAVFDSPFTKVNSLLTLTAPGFALKTAALPVVPTAQQFLSSVQRVVGDDASHSVAQSTIRITANLDTYLVASSPTFSYTGATFLSIGYSTGIRRGLVNFDLSAMAGLSVSEAHLFLYNTDNAATTGNGTLQAHRAATANAGWNEGALHLGVTATGIAPSWNKKTQSPSVDWAGSAGLSTSSTDYDSTLMGSAAWTDGAPGWLNLNLNASLMSTMIANNAGFRLSAADESSGGKVVILHSRQNGNPTYVPYLEVTLASLITDSSSILIIASDAGATWSNTAVATVNDAPISTVWMELPLSTLGAANMSFFVPSGVNVWYVVLGPK